MIASGRNDGYIGGRKRIITKEQNTFNGSRFEMESSGTVKMIQQDKIYNFSTPFTNKNFLASVNYQNRLA